jgi:hypothetical protein
MSYKTGLMHQMILLDQLQWRSSEIHSAVPVTRHIATTTVPYLNFNILKFHIVYVFKFLSLEQLFSEY